MARYRPYSRREFRRRLARWAQRNLKLLLTLTAGAVGLFALATVILTALFPRSAFSWWLLGVLQTLLVAVFLHLLHAAFLAHDGEAIWHLRGAWGEENTRSELQRAKRKKLIWGWVDSISLQAGDLDHLVVSRRGGLIAVDSKWRNQTSDTAAMAKAANKARLRAEALTQTLLTKERAARHRGKGNPLSVTPVVVVWGAAQHDVPDNARVDGIEFVAGRKLIGWLSKLDGRPVDEAAASDMLERLEGYRAATWDNTKPGTL
jgi:hypothetical protein